MVAFNSSRIQLARDRLYDLENSGEGLTNRFFVAVVRTPVGKYAPEETLVAGINNNFDIVFFWNTGALRREFQRRLVAAEFIEETEILRFLSRPDPAMTSTSTITVPIILRAPRIARKRTIA